MPGYFGTESQQRLQAQVEASAAFTAMTPGACQAGRFMACDDPDRFGWERIFELLDRDGVFGFRFVPVGAADEIRARLRRRGFRFDTWDVFLADRATALAASEAVVSRGLPDGLIELERPTDPESVAMESIQAHISLAGVAPFSGSMLAGALGPATTIVVGDERGSVVATAHGYLPHNAFSAYARHAWGGLVAVAEAQRGRGLGAYVNARLIVSVFRDLDATHVYELVSATNLASRRMVEVCGLRAESSLVCGSASRDDVGRFTR